MSYDEIRFNKPSLEGNELAYIQTAVETGHTSCSGPYAAAASELLREWLGAPDVLLTTSCTAALEMSALLLALEPGDTVVVPSFTFTSTATAFAREGAKILFCDIERETLGLDPAHLETLLDDSVRAVVPVHYARLRASFTFTTASTMRSGACASSAVFRSASVSLGKQEPP